MWITIVSESIVISHYIQTKQSVNTLTAIFNLYNIVLNSGLKLNHEYQTVSQSLLLSLSFDMPTSYDTYDPSTAVTQLIVINQSQEN